MQPDSRIPGLLLEILDPRTRPDAIAALTATLETERILLFLKDPEIGISLPAPGFLQVLPEASQWRAFIGTLSERAGTAMASLLPNPDTGPDKGPDTGADAVPGNAPDTVTRSPAQGIASADGAAWICLGGDPAPEKLMELHAWLPWVSKAFESETRARLARAKEEMALGAVEASNRMSANLDGLRRNLEVALRKMEAAEAQSRKEAEERKKTLEALRESEDRLRQSQKMEAVGKLAGGIAHDFNNLLTSINGYSELALTMVDESNPIQGYLVEIKKSGDRAAALTRQLLAYGRKQILQPKLVNLNTIVFDMHRMLQRLLGEDIEIRTHLDPGLGMIRMDPGQLEQILLNLALNARDAMPQGGRLVFETGNIVLDEEFANSRLEIGSGPSAALIVSDTGFGMTPEIRDRIFEPFFTTKEVGKGTGLGLSSVYGIVKQSGGGISVDSHPGEGTAFKLYFPLVGEPGREGAGRAAGRADYSRGSETILLVEDEEAVRKFIRHSLAKLGYNVLEAKDGMEAMHIQDAFKKPIHLLLTDVVMPRMNGVKLSEMLLATRPGTKVIYMSGYAENSILPHAHLVIGENFLPKPFSPSLLADKVREILAPTALSSPTSEMLPAQTKDQP